MANAIVFTKQGMAVATNRIKGTGTEPLYVAFGTGGGSRTAGVDDIYSTLTQSGSRTQGTSSVVTTTNTNDTYRVVASFVAGGTVTINEIMTLDASTAGNSFVSATITGISLNQNDTITVTVDLKSA